MTSDQSLLPYSNIILYETPRLLSLQDRELYSPTYGCFDRNYWQWKFVDFPGARFQEGAFSQALLYSEEIEGSPYYQDDKMRAWSVAGMKYWAKIIGRDGSLNEAYPNEHSFVATAFSLLSIAETYQILKSEINDLDEVQIRSGMVRAGDWLSKNIEKHAFISNHILGAAAALYKLHIITGEEKYKIRSRQLIEIVFAKQSKEGWLLEYTGADPGYLTQGIYYLARYWQDSGDETALRVLKNATEFLSYFIHPDHTLGGEYGSRNTEFYFPGGLEILVGTIPVAAAISDFMLDGISSGVSAGLATMDAYNFMPLFSNYLLANHERAKRGDKGCCEQILPCQRQDDFIKYLPDSKLAVAKKRSYYAILGAGKGGVIKIYSVKGQRLLYSNCGYKGILDNGDIISTQSQGDAIVDYDEGKRTLYIKGTFLVVKPKVFTPAMFIMFRLFNVLLCPIGSLADWMKNKIVRNLIFNNKRYPAQYCRRVEFRPDAVAIYDTIESNDLRGLVELSRLDKFTAVHMGSSKYFQKQELGSQSILKTLSATSIVKGKFEESYLVITDENA
jgi:hypothetical protein